MAWLRPYINLNIKNRNKCKNIKFVTKDKIKKYIVYEPLSCQFQRSCLLMNKNLVSKSSLKQYVTMYVTKTCNI